MSADDIRMDEDGVSAVITTLSGHAALASETAHGIVSALSDAETSVRSTTLLIAMGGLVDRLRHAASPVSVHIDALAGGIREAATALIHTDNQLGADASALRR